LYCRPPGKFCRFLRGYLPMKMPAFRVSCINPSFLLRFHMLIVFAIQNLFLISIEICVRFFILKYWSISYGMQFDALVAALPVHEGGEEAQLQRIYELQVSSGPPTFFQVHYFFASFENVS
jgi:hypothetical protein